MGAIIGPDHVFMDVEDIVPGQNFAETIDRSIAGCSTALIVIGPRWLRILTERAGRSEPDYVSHEVASALAHKLRIVPVLVGGAAMPGRSELPAPLRDLPLRHAAELRDATFKEDCDRLAKHLGLRPSGRRKWMLGAAAAAALTAILVIAWALRPGPPPDPRLATARTQTELGQHQSAFRTYGEILKSNPNNADVLDLQADAAMAWLRDFRVSIGEGQKAEEIAGPPLAEIIAALEAALARADGRSSRAGDVLAHLGWAHWLNQRIASREFGPAAEQSLRKSLEVDPANVFGNIMLGSWLLQTRGDTAQALRHLEAAEKTNQHRAFLRQMQLGGMIYNDDALIPPALMRVLNTMRTGGESLSARQRSRILSYFRPGNNDQLQQMLSAVSPAGAWATFLWLDEPKAGDEMKYEGFRRRFIQARILELEGKAAEAYTLLAALDRDMRSARFNGRLLDDVTSASNRLRGSLPAAAR